MSTHGLLTMTEVGARLHCSEMTARRRVRAAEATGEVSLVRIGRGTYLHERDLQALAEGAR